ncbi:hypothetical protein GCM10014715_27060 [Streptomyces spiralis]|uniref:Uncharacterized protein n=1 Tax=Streptomyces spiralis TaxID=66376 RepID=A0A918ZUW3_9ACTN|nr:hypothetical protein GCM10014715_27060 [Streptomyces spiralis]
MRLGAVRREQVFTSGRGHTSSLTRQLLERGDSVAATTRCPERLTAALGDGADTSRLLPLAVDLRDEEQVKQAVNKTVEHFGGLDVVVNNAATARASSLWKA